MLEIVCFTGNSGLTDYAVSLARAFGSCSRLLTSSTLPERFRNMGFEVLTPFRRSRHYPFDLFLFVHGTLARKPDFSLWQGPLKFPLLDGIAARFLRFCGTRCAVTVHDVLPHYPRPWSGFVFGFYYRSFERVVVHSQFALEGVRALGVSAPILVIPHGVYDLFQLSGIGRDGARERLPGLRDKKDSIAVLFFGHLETRKGLFEFLEVARRLQGEDRFIFMISGGSSLNGVDERRLRSASMALGNVVLDIRRIPFEEVEYHFSACDIVALPYQEGTTSGVLKLSIAFGKPVVASAVGDLQEEIPIQAGICVSLGDDFVGRFADAICEVASDLDRWSNGMRGAGERLNWSRISDEIGAFLQVSFKGDAENA